MCAMTRSGWSAWWKPAVHHPHGRGHLDHQAVRGRRGGGARRGRPQIPQSTIPASRYRWLCRMSCSSCRWMRSSLSRSRPICLKTPFDTAKHHSYCALCASSGWRKRRLCRAGQRRRHPAQAAAVSCSAERCATVTRPPGDGKRNMGLGLSVCNAIVRANGGTMHAQNRDGGAEFIFTACR